MKAILIKIAIGVLPEIIDMIIHALQDLANKPDNNINNEMVGEVILNKGKIIQTVKQK